MKEMFAGHYDEMDFSNKEVLKSHSRKDVTQVLFQIGGYTSSYKTVTYTKRKGGASILVSSGFGSGFRSRLDRGYERKINSFQWEIFLLKLFFLVGFSKWHSSYVDDEIDDGTQWKFAVRFADNTEVRYGGSNDYPPKFNLLESIIF